MMEEPVVKKQVRRYTPEQKAAYVKQWMESGKTQRVFSAEQGMHYKLISNWSVLMRKRLEGVEPTNRRVRKTKKKASGFVAIQVKKAESKIRGDVFAEVTTPAGMVISLYHEVPADYLRHIARP